MRAETVRNLKENGPYSFQFLVTDLIDEDAGEQPDAPAGACQESQGQKGARPLLHLVQMT